MFILNIFKCIGNIRSTTNFRSFHFCGNFFETLEQKQLLINYIQMRWKKEPRRKPRWMPIAKSKLYIIPPKPNISEFEKNTTLLLMNNYLEEIRSIQDYCAVENMLDGEAKPMKDAQDFSELLRLNEEENKRVAKIRETVLELELSSAAQALIEKNEEHEQWLLAKNEEVEALVKYEKSESSTFVRLENLESAIEHAIDNPVNYNFAIGLDGNIHWEKDPHPVVSPYWEDDKPRQRLDRPPYRPYKVKRVREFNHVYPKGFWI